MGMTQNAASAPTAGQTVTLNVPSAWHYGLTGTVVEVDTVGELATVRFTGHGTVRVPAAVVLSA